MLSALLTFLGGTAFRWIIGEVVSYFKAKQDHTFEMARLDQQNRFAAEEHTRTIELVNLQAQTQIAIIDRKRDADVAVGEADAFTEAVKNVGRLTGIKLVDAWNGVIRPALATICIYVWVRHMLQVNWVPDEWDRGLIAAALGVFVGGRISFKGR